MKTTAVMKSVPLTYMLSGVLIFFSTNVVAQSKFIGGTYNLYPEQIQQINVTKEGQGSYGLEIWPLKNSVDQPTGELGGAPLKYIGGPEVFEIAALITSNPSIIRGVTYSKDKVVGYWGSPSYISSGKKIPMYRILSFFFHPANIPPEKEMKSGEPQGWCCAQGKVFASLPQACAQQNGLHYSTNRAEVEQMCNGATRGEARPSGKAHEATPITLPKTR